MGPLALMLALPLAGFVVNGLVGPRLPKALVALIACGLPALAFVVTVRAFLAFAEDGVALSETLFTWVAIPGFKLQAALYFDPITAVMCLVVTGIGTLIHVYSIGYMAGDKNYSRYFAYLNLFLFFMLMLVLGKNLVVLFAGWEGVGLASYLLIGFWFEDAEKTAAGLKAFVVNRVGDAGFVLAAFLIHIVAGSLDFQTVNAYFTGHPPAAAASTAIVLLLFAGACGKSAQIPLHVWLPDAMAGPTPVSALIHAATMVTAGVYLLARMSGVCVQAPAAMSVIAWVGALTALLAATIGVTQFNLKKVLAYSTISQIGLMVMACGLGAFAVGLFHLVTHAFFKACLFLCAGAVLHALQGEEDMRRMGGLARRLPFTFGTFLAGALALCGIPPFAGFFSKDEILWIAWSSAGGSPWIWAVASIASGLTAFYMFRALYLTFFGAGNVPARLLPHVHEPPASMSAVLGALALGSLLAGFIGLPNLWRELLHVSAPFYDFVAPALPAAGEPHHADAALELALALVALAAALAGIGLAWLIYGRTRRAAPAGERRAGFTYTLVSNGYFFDAFYSGVVVRFFDWASESLLPALEAALARASLVKPADGARCASQLLARLQTGNVQAYVFYVLAGLAVTLCWAALHV
ncbi:MAG TPA: NADH-quinone oxidoreductase subunit L [Burkholderiales bacterium]|nr:NADH-quinone oxidoreductase subunit L [Burkholderiales bacterium]